MSTTSDYEQHQLDEQSVRELDAHAEQLKRWLEAGCCPKCRKPYVLEINPKNITFRCSLSGHSCNWSAIYPIATIGNSSPLHAENARLKEEVAALRAYVEGLNHDFAETLAHCDEHHVVGSEQ